MDSSNRYGQTVRAKKWEWKRGCYKGKAGDGGRTSQLCGATAACYAQEERSCHLPNPKRLPLLAFMRVVCAHLLYCKTFHVGKYVVLQVEISGDVNACVCVDTGPAWSSDCFLSVCFPAVLGVAARVAIEKIHDIGGIASHTVIVIPSPVLSLLKCPVSTRCCCHMKHFDL